MFKYIFLLLIVSFTLLFSTNTTAANVPPDIVTVKSYDYATLTSNLNDLKYRHSDILNYWSLGQSVYGREIYVVTLGTGDAAVYIDGARHGREWISTYINMKKIEEYSNAVTYGDGTYGNYNVTDLLKNITFYFVPMVNPDGVDLTIHGLKAFPEDSHQNFISLNEGSTSFRRWKANALGVDLNRIWDAGWESIANSGPVPSWYHYKGIEPFDHRAVEDLIIRDFVYEIDPEIAVSYHSTGRILYWWWRELNPNLVDLNRQIASKVSQLTNYPLYPPNRPHTNGGGMTDWFTKEFQRPGLTPELAPYHNHQPVDLRWFAEEWERNKYVGLYVAEKSHMLWWERVGKQLSMEREQLVKNMKTHWAYDAYKELFNDGILTETHIDFATTISPETFKDFLAKAEIQTEIDINKTTFHRLDLARMINDIIKPNIPTLSYVANYGHYAGMFRDLDSIYFPHRAAFISVINKGILTGYHNNLWPYKTVTYADALVVIHRIISDENHMYVTADRLNPIEDSTRISEIELPIYNHIAIEPLSQQLDKDIDSEIATLSMLFNWAGLDGITNDVIKNNLTSQGAEQLLNQWFSGHVITFDGGDFSEVELHVSKGYPVVCWLANTDIMTSSDYTVLITGVDNEYVYLNNPLSGKRESYKKEHFISEWNHANKISLSLKIELQTPVY